MEIDQETLEWARKKLSGTYEGFTSNQVSWEIPTCNQLHALRAPTKTFPLSLKGADTTPPRALLQRKPPPGTIKYCLA